MTKYLLVLCFSAVLFADTATVAPDADTGSTGGFGAAPLFSKINEDIDSPDGVTISSGNNPSALVSFTVTCPAGIGTITAANLRIRAGQNNVARNISLAVSWSATAGTDFNTGTLNKTALQNYASGNITGLSISKGQCDGSTLSFTPTTTGSATAAIATIDTFNLDIEYSAGAGRRRQAVIIARKN